MVAQANGVSRRAIHAGLEELASEKMPAESQSKRIRKTGAGRKSVIATDSGAMAALEKLVAPTSMAPPGEASNLRLDETLRAKATALIGAHYCDFEPTLANEKLTERHDIHLPVESTRQPMTLKTAIDAYNPAAPFSIKSVSLDFWPGVSFGVFSVAGALPCAANFPSNSTFASLRKRFISASASFSRFCATRKRSIAGMA